MPTAAAPFDLRVLAMRRILELFVMLVRDINGVVEDVLLFLFVEALLIEDPFLTSVVLCMIGDAVEVDILLDLGTANLRFFCVF